MIGCIVCMGVGCNLEIYKARLCYEHYRKYIHHKLNSGMTAERVNK